MFDNWPETIIILIYFSNSIFGRAWKIVNETYKWIASYKWWISFFYQNLPQFYFLQSVLFCNCVWYFSDNQRIFEKAKLFCVLIILMKWLIDGCLNGLLIIVMCVWLESLLSLILNNCVNIMKSLNFNIVDYSNSHVHSIFKFKYRLYF